MEIDREKDRAKASTETTLEEETSETDGMKMDVLHP
jgi:hypothetical protein